MRVLLLILLFFVYIFIGVILENSILQYFEISCPNDYYTKYGILTKAILKLIYIYGSFPGVIFYFIFVLLTKKITRLLKLYFWGFVSFIILFLSSYIIVDLILHFDFIGRSILSGIKKNCCECIVFYFDNIIYPLFFLVLISPFWIYILGDWFWKRGEYAEK